MSTGNADVGNGKIQQSEVEPIIDDVARYHGTGAKKELMDAFGKYWGKEIKDVSKEIIWEAGTYGSLAWEVLNRLIEKNKTNAVNVTAYKVL